MHDKFENYANPSSIIWQPIETDYWKASLKKNLQDFLKETNSKVAEKILANYDGELENFVQVCPIEMLDKLDNPISLNKLKFKSA